MGMSGGWREPFLRQTVPVLHRARSGSSPLQHFFL